jgi:hypothetical protein
MRVAVDAGESILEGEFASLEYQGAQAFGVDSVATGEGLDRRLQLQQANGTEVLFAFVVVVFYIFLCLYPFSVMSICSMDTRTTTITFDSGIVEVSVRFRMIEGNSWKGT